MTRYLILTLLFCFSLNASNDFDTSTLDAITDSNTENSAVINLTGAPSSVVFGCVNVITGDYLDHECDLVIAGNDPITFERSYTSSDHSYHSLQTSWFHNHHATVRFDPESSFGTSICNIDGCRFWATNETLPARHEACEDLYLPSYQFEKGYTNCSSGEISGRTNLLNYHMKYTRKFTDCWLTEGSGQVQYFVRRASEDSLVRKKITKPNKNVLEYNLRLHDHLKKVTAKNSAGVIATELEIEDPVVIESWLQRPRMGVTTDDGRRVRYFFKLFEGKHHHKVRKQRFLLERVERPNAPNITYDYTEPNKYSLERIKSKKYPDNRFLNIEYYDEKKIYEFPNDGMSLWSRKQKCFNTVYRLQAPVGHDATPLPIATFRSMNKDITPRRYSRQCVRVYDALNNYVDYFKNQDERLTYIERYNSDETLFCLEAFEWKNSFLKERRLENKYGQCLFARKYTYDKSHNINHEEIYGNLRGSFDRPSPGNRPNPRQESLVKTYEYTQDGRNLLFKEHNPHYSFIYFYENERALMTAKFLWSQGSVKLREFYTYDASGALISQITDNGTAYQADDLTGVTKRQIKRIVNTYAKPQGLPKVIRELYFDVETQQEIKLKKTVNQYDNWGRLILQEVYDAENNFVYNLQWEYDDNGNIIKEIDRFGLVTTRRFDANNNKKYEQGPNFDFLTKYFYDFSNRLIRQNEVYPNGKRLSEIHSYDLCSNKISSTDIYGNTTRYEYDAFHRLIKTILPEVPDDKEELYHPTLTFEYDEFNNLVHHTDAKGNSFTTLYTLHGKPYYKQYPDTTFESFEYDVTGALVKETAKDGSYILYTNDYLSRPTHISRYTSNDVLIDTTNRVYDGFNLLFEKNGYGIETFFKYDGMGRLTEKVITDAKTCYFYDTLGRVNEERTYHGYGENDFISKKTTYDIADRPVEESVEDCYGNVQKLTKTTYDISGNKSCVTLFNETGISCLQADYDVHGQVVHLTDPDGNSVHTTYLYDYVDNHGITVPYNEAVDSKGTITITIGDALGRTASISKKNPLGSVVEKTEYVYDSLGNQVARKDNVFVKDELKNVITTLWEYDSFGQVTVIIEAVGTPEQRSSRYYYDELNRVTEYVKPDGISLLYSYDHKGRLKEQSATDNTFHYNYFYDSFDHPIKIVDTCQNLTTQRIYNSKGQLHKETLANGLALEYDNDLIGRVVALHYPDGSGVSYTYDGARIASVSRTNIMKKARYTHQYKEFDLSGNCLKMQMIGNAGELSQKFDKLNRVILIEGAGWKEDCDSYDTVGNLATIKITDLEGTNESSYHYDDLYQLSHEDGVVTHDYLNDSLSNHVEKDHHKQSFNALNQLLEDDKGTFVYDLNGNLIRRNRNGNVVEYTYDGLNRLTQVITADCTYTYTYDSFNRRISKSDGDNVIHYLYAGVDEVAAYDAEGVMRQLRILGLGKGSEIGAAVAMEFDGKAYAPIHDHNGNVCALVDAATGEMAESYRYSAFGEEPGTTNNPLNPWRYASKRCDVETGFIYFGERYFDPETCRWITNDPLGFEGGVNLYAYVSNRPLSLVDLYGLYEQGGFWDNVVCPVINTIVNGISTVVDYAQNLLNKFLNSTYFYPEKPFVGSVGSITCASHFVLFGNGMWNNTGEPEQSAEYISGLSGGHLIHFLNMATGGKFRDIGRVAIARTFNLQSLSTEAWVESFMEYFANAPDDALAMAIAHSEGCTHLREALRRLPPEIRERIIVRAFAPSAYISPDLCHSVVHYCSYRDFVPLLDPMGFIACYGTIKYLPAPKGASWFEHGFDSVTYQDVLKHDLKKYFAGEFKPLDKNSRKKNKYW